MVACIIFCAYWDFGEEKMKDVQKIDYSVFRWRIFPISYKYLKINFSLKSSTWAARLNHVSAVWFCEGSKYAV